jgi:hypothetical protein
MAHLMQQLAEYTGACCVRKLLHDNKDKSPQELADRLGVTVRSIYYWRERARKGTCKCKNLPNCANITEEPPEPARPLPNIFSE